MALPNVTMAALSGLVREYAPGRFVNTVIASSKILTSGALPIVDVKGAEYLVSINGGAASSVAILDDHDDRPGGNTTLPSQAKFTPVPISGTIALGLTASQMDVAAGSGLGSILRRKIDDAAEGAQRMLGRNVFGTSVTPAAIATWSGTAANSTVTVDFADGSLFIKGASYDYCDTSANLSVVVRCTGKVGKAVGGNSSRVGSAVSFILDIANGRTGAITALSATGIAVDDVFALRGVYNGTATPVPTRKINNFELIASGAALGGLTSAQCIGWEGTSQNLAGPYSQEAAELFAGVLEGEGGDFTHAIMGNMLAKTHKIMSGGFGSFNGIGATALPQASQAGATMSKYNKDSGLELSGRPVVVDKNCPATSLVLTNSDNVFLGRWREFTPETVGGEELFTDTTTLAVKGFVTGMYQVVVENRASVGVMTGITGL